MGDGEEFSEDETVSISEPTFQPSSPEYALILEKMNSIHSLFLQKFDYLSRDFKDLKKSNDKRLSSLEKRVDNIESNYDKFRGAVYLLYVIVVIITAILSYNFAL